MTPSASAAAATTTAAPFPGEDPETQELAAPHGPRRSTRGQGPRIRTQAAALKESSFSCRCLLPPRGSLHSLSGRGTVSERGRGARHAPQVGRALQTPRGTPPGSRPAPPTSPSPRPCVFLARKGPRGHPARGGPLGEARTPRSCPDSRLGPGSLRAEVPPGCLRPSEKPWAPGAAPASPWNGKCGGKCGCKNRSSSQSGQARSLPKAGLGACLLAPLPHTSWAPPGPPVPGWTQMGPPRPSGLDTVVGTL